MLVIDWYGTIWGMVVMGTGTSFELMNMNIGLSLDYRWIIIRPSVKRTEADKPADPGHAMEGELCRT